MAKPVLKDPKPETNTMKRNGTTKVDLEEATGSPAFDANHKVRICGRDSSGNNYCWGENNISSGGAARKWKVMVKRDQAPCPCRTRDHDDLGPDDKRQKGTLDIAVTVINPGEESDPVVVRQVILQ